MALKLYSKTGVARLEFSPSSSDKQSERIMGEVSISLSFTLPTAIEVVMGDYVRYEGRQYVALSNYTPTKKSTREYQYSLSLYTIESTLASVKVLKPASEHQELNFSYDARPHEHIQLIVDNANRAGLGTWRVGTALSAGSVNIEYNNKYCLEALGDIAEAYNSEWWIEDGVINLTKREHGSPIRLAYQEGLTSLYASAAREKPITRLYPLGSTRNIDTSKYGSSRLHLPHNARYIERNSHLGLIEASEEASFSHIYPRYTGVVSSVRTEDRRSSEGKPYKVYYIKDSAIPFNPNLYELQGLTKHVVFQSGELNGRDFEANYLTNTKEWEIITQFPYEGTQLPREPLIPKTGDKYIPYNFRMPDEYISRAEEELLAEANKYLDKVSIDNTIYKASTDYTYLLSQGISLSLGQRITLHDIDLFPSTSGVHQTRITAISRSLLNPQKMEIECSATIERGRIEQMESGLDKMRAAYHRVEAAMPSILRSNDSTDPSEDNVLSAVRSIRAIQRTALRKDTDDRTSYSLGSTEHVPGLVGWLLSPEGDLDLRNLKVSGTLEVDEFRKNRISIQEGEHYFSSGNAIVEEVLEGNKIRVKGEQGEVSSLIAGDYVIGKWANASGSVEVCKIKITAVSGLVLSYTLAPNTTIRPRVGMHLAQMGHDTDTRRQRASVVRANAIIQYAGVKGWEILPQHITAVMGDLEGFSLEPFGSLEGSGVYINNAYITGTITQKSADGRSTRPLPYYKGEWTAASIAHTGDQYLYAGHKWTYQGVTPTTTAPSATANWIDDGEEAVSLMSKLAIGGRNYVRRRYHVEQEGRLLNITLTEELPAGTYTFSCYAEIKRNKGMIRVLPARGGEYAQFTKSERSFIKILTPEDKNGVYTGVIEISSPMTNIYVYPQNSWASQTDGGLINFRWIKLERGNKATDYTLAPEDVEEQMTTKANTALADAKNYANSKTQEANTYTNSKASEVKVYASQQASTALADAKTYTDSKITEAKTSIQQIGASLETSKSGVQAAQQTADAAKARAENTYTKAIADSKISDAEQRAIEQAESKANEALAEATRRDAILKIELEDKVSTLLSSINTIQGDLQRQIDKQIEMYWGEQAPTGRIGWAASEDAKHEGDTYTVRPPLGVVITAQNAKQYPNVGKSWRWHVNGWVEIADTDVTRALALAGEAKASADGKVTHYRANTIPTGYKQGDLWTLTTAWNGYKAGSILTATQDEIIGQYNPSHWREELRYTDDTAIQNLQVGGRNYIRKQYNNKTQDGQSHNIRLTETLPAGTYTFSCYAEILRNGGYISVLPYNNNGRDYLYGQSFIHLPTQTSGVYTGTIVADRPFHGINIYPQYASANAGQGGLVLFRWIKLERGNKATDYTLAPEDVDANILSAEERAKQYALEGDRTLKTQLEDRLSVNDYLRQAIAKGTKQEAGKIDTGLVLTEVLGVKDHKGLVTSYMSGESQYPAFAAGVRGFGTERETRMVEIMHDGRVAIGQLRMLGEGGVISFIPRGGDTPYLNIGGVPKELSDMISGQFSGTDRRSQPFSRQTYSDVREEIVLISAFRVAKNGTTVAISGDIAVDTHAYYDRSNSSREDDSVNIRRIHGSDASIHIQLQHRAINSGGAYSSVASWTAAASSVYQKIWGLEDEIEQSTGEVRQNINERLSGLEAGDYQLIAIIEQSSFNGASSSFQISAFAMTSEQAEREIHLSDQAFYAIFGSRRFFHIDQQAITIQHKLTVKGETDMPGILASGRVNQYGTIETAWGAKANRQGKSTAFTERYGDNLYRVYHTVGHTDYSVQITPFDTRDAACIMELTAYYFTCRFNGTTDNRNYAHRFCYAIFGENK